MLSETQWRQTNCARFPAREISGFGNGLNDTIPPMNCQWKTGCRMLDAGCWMPDAGCRMLDAGCWIEVALASKMTGE